MQLGKEHGEQIILTQQLVLNTGFLPTWSKLSIWAHDRLVRGFAQGSQDCGINGQLDPGLTVAYQIYICRDLFYANNYVSSQFHAQAYGTMGSGDSLAFEMWRGSGNYNDPMNLFTGILQMEWYLLPLENTPTFHADPQITWSANPNLGNADLFLGGNTFSYGFLLHSDSSVQLKDFTLTTSFNSVYQRYRNTL